MSSSRNSLTRLRIPPALVALIRGLHPQLKRKVRSGLDEIVEDAAAGKTLRDELSGLRSHRLGRFRIIYRQPTHGWFRMVAMGPRRTISERPFRGIKRKGPASTFACRIAAGCCWRFSFPIRL